MISSIEGTSGTAASFFSICKLSHADVNYQHGYTHTAGLCNTTTGIFHFSTHVMALYCVYYISIYKRSCSQKTLSKLIPQQCSIELKRFGGKSILKSYQARRRIYLRLSLLNIHHIRHTTWFYNCTYCFYLFLLFMSKVSSQLNCMLMNNNWAVCVVLGLYLCMCTYEYAPKQIHFVEYEELKQYNKMVVRRQDQPTMTTMNFVFDEAGQFTI